MWTASGCHLGLGAKVGRQEAIWAQRRDVSYDFFRPSRCEPRDREICLEGGCESQERKALLDLCIFEELRCRPAQLTKSLLRDVDRGVVLAGRYGANNLHPRLTGLAVELGHSSRQFFPVHIPRADA